uniref:HYLS1_C domain-containing protein n=1 Tax=Anopheles dirus TaxID=7168 RepID=A0A182NE28_9DIPT
YRNITAAQLKEFQEDLKKLVKSDAKQCFQDDGGNRENKTVFERLHSGNTLSYKAKQTPRSSEKTQLAGPLTDKENQIVTSKPVRCKDNDPCSKMWIRSKSSHSVRRSDPVALYHSYQKDWNKFKQKLPGENDHSELRWKIRSKLLGD